LLEPPAIVPYKAWSSKGVLIRPLISLYTVPIKAFILVLGEVNSNKVLEASQASLGAIADAIAGAFSAKPTRPALVR